MSLSSKRKVAWASGDKPNKESRNPGKEFLEIGNRQSTFGNSESGGIAQLVERQLCKLEVRGSNPLASRDFGLRKPAAMF